MISKLSLVAVLFAAGSGFACGGGGGGAAGGTGGNAGAAPSEDGGSDGSGTGDAGGPASGDGGAPAIADTCPGDIIATWEVDGKALRSATSTYIEAGTWGMNFVECVDDDNDAVLQFAGIPLPVEAGTYALTSKLLHGAQTTGDPGAYYSEEGGGPITSETNYFIDPEIPGELVITDVDSAESTISGTFSFSAVNDAGSKTIEVTGEISGAHFTM